jgi:hypothetical protein
MYQNTAKPTKTHKQSLLPIREWHAHSLADQFLETSLADLFYEPPTLIHDNLAMGGGSPLRPQPLHSTVMNVAAGSAPKKKKGTQDRCPVAPQLGGRGGAIASLRAERGTRLRAA